MPENLRIKLYEKDPKRKLQLPVTGEAGNPYLIDVIEVPWTDEVDTLDRRRRVAREKARAHAGGRDPSVNHSSDERGACFVCVVTKRPDDSPPR